MTAPIIRVNGVTKDYGGLRPLRIEAFSMAPGETVVVQGLDETAASVLVDLLTGTALPDAGQVMVAGVPTADIDSHEAWLAFLEQFGIVNPRVVLLDELTVRQNLAVPLTLDLDPIPEAARRRAEGLAHAVGLSRAALDARLSSATPLTRFRVRLGRAIAHEPRVLLLEHPTLGIPASDVGACGEALATIVRGGETSVLAISGDDRFARMVATRRLSWTPSTGRLAERGGWRAWFGGH